MAFSIRCPVCRKKFRWAPVDGKIVFPEYCPNDACESRIAHDRDDDDIVVPFIRSSATSANDALYRQMEAASEKRAEMAAQQLGVPVSEMSDLKITNLSEANRPGDVAAMPVNNAVSREVAANPGLFGHQPAAGLAFSGAVAGGYAPNAGARFQSVLRDAHQERMSGVQAVTSDTPALELQNPAYRRRV